MQKTIVILSRLFHQLYQNFPEAVQALPRSGSNRYYFRLTGGNKSVIGAFNADKKENEAFFSFTQTFRKLKINVPDLLVVAPDRQHYLITDLGNRTLFDLLNNPSAESGEQSGLCQLKFSLIELLKIQLEGGKFIDFDKCYPRAAFDRQSILWDLNYFKYEFLKLSGILFEEQALENDFNTLTDFLLEAPARYFMYRDFQSRNIMIIDNRPWFLDYQGGREGPLQYDLASILYSPKTRLNEVQREVFLQFYLDRAEKQLSINRENFTRYYYGFVLIRILQALGAYGFRGLYEKKTNFRNSIPVAVQNLGHLFGKGLIAPNLPHIKAIVNNLMQSKWAEKYSPAHGKLTIRVTSFSYKKGIPDDPSGNGGGFVFDCRGLPNPGRYKEYQSLTGCDPKIIDYLEKYEAVQNFQKNVQEIVKISIQEYLKRGFNHLCVNFGCTGGQHRSVYHAEKFSAWVKKNFPVEVILLHTGID